MRKDLYDLAEKYVFELKGRGDLEQRFNDNLDFLEVSVWALRELIEAAYELGQNSVTDQKTHAERVRANYPIGTRIRLIKMDDKQAPPVGTMGTVTGVDDIGSLLVQWDTGSRLNVLYGIDECEK